MESLSTDVRKKILTIGTFSSAFRQFATNNVFMCAEAIPEEWLNQVVRKEDIG
jgi:hypothetical protein